MDCTNAPEEFCPEHKTYIFNTNIVFDRSGAVIDRYRKINLYYEPYTPALRPELGLFSTDFGVRFGHFICFDLMFQVPATQVVQKYNISDIIFSTMWYSEIPFLTAIQVQESYAYTMGVNLIAAGTNNILMGTSGSGIYSGKTGALISIMPGVSKTQLLVSRVPKRPGHPTFKWPGPIYDDPKAPDELLLNKDVHLQTSTSRLLRPGSQEFTLVDKDVRCVFRIKINITSDITKKVPHFRAFIKDGTSVYAHRQGGVVYCAVVACENEDVFSCPYRYEKGEKFTEFEELEIKMITYPNQYNKSLKCDNTVYYPTSLKCNKFPLRPQDFIYENSIKYVLDNVTGTHENKGHVEIFYRIRRPQNELISFALWGRAYLRDVHLKNGSLKESVLFLLCFCIITVCIFYYVYKVSFKHSKEAEYKYLKQIS
ncbi:unnamed protein product [Diatraea saccharalis]|uniref:CN hydrolase domain-containing protein n=1 Tax=Diatraea saccharalis TaxID=40085 RepID=A0A9N9R7Z4_9NEOP|nr:unnamed protein product [Diatraea saccharalis]